MNKYRIVVTHGCDSKLCYIPQVRKLFLWWILNFYGQIHFLSIHSDRKYGTDTKYYELSEQDAYDTIALHKKLGVIPVG